MRDEKKPNRQANCQTLSSNREENFSQSITMGKFQNFELNEEQRRIQMLKHQQRMDLRAKFWKNMTDPNRHGSGEGGHMVNMHRKMSHNAHNLKHCLYQCYVIKLKLCLLALPKQIRLLLNEIFQN